MLSFIFLSLHLTDWCYKQDAGQIPRTARRLSPQPGVICPVCSLDQHGLLLQSEHCCVCVTGSEEWRRGWLCGWAECMTVSLKVCSEREWRSRGPLRWKNWWESGLRRATFLEVKTNRQTPPGWWAGRGSPSPSWLDGSAVIHKAGLRILTCHVSPFLLLKLRFSIKIFL